MFWFGLVLESEFIVLVTKRFQIILEGVGMAFGILLEGFREDFGRNFLHGLSTVEETPFEEN